MSDRDHDHDHDELPIEDVTVLLSRSGAGSSSLGLNTKRPKVLEIHQVWGDLLVDTRHFTPADRSAIRVGPTVGHRWRLLGVDMGWVPAPLHLVLPYAPPMWSEVESDWKCDFYGATARELFEVEDDRWVAVLDRRWDGFVEIDGDRRALATLEGDDDVVRVPIEDGKRLMVEVDGLTYLAHLVHEGARVADRRAPEPDYPLLAIGSTAAFVGLMFALAVFFAPRPPVSDVVEIPEHLVMGMPVPPPEDPTKDEPGDPEPEGQRAKKEEGRAGEPDAKMNTARGKQVDVNKLELDRQVAENAGAMGFFSDSGELAGVFSSSALSADLQGGVGGLIGAKGTQIGAGGLAGRGSGLGGGGDYDGIGGMGTKGPGTGDRPFGNGGGGAKKTEGALATVGDPMVIGALDRAVIDEVIKNHLNQLKHCYQRELAKDPSLGGKIVTKFTIAKDGRVSASDIRASTMGNAAVEGCIRGMFLRMRFPEPMGGGIVIVSYPLMFAL